jgi:hypothetical protein
MPRSAEGHRYLAVAREDLGNFVEAQALRTKSTNRICQFFLTDLFARYGSIGRIKADNGELNAKEAKTFFQRLNVDLRLVTTYNPEANGKSERGHQPLVAGLVKACDGDVKSWARLLPFALWADRSTISRTTGYAPSELMMGAIMPTPHDLEEETWLIPEWADNARREDLIAWRIKQLERREVMETDAKEKLRIAREKSAADANSKRTTRTTDIEPGDWVLVWKSQLDVQHDTESKFAKRWNGPFVVLDVDQYNTYKLRTLDGIVIARRMAGKRIKLFKQREV